MLLQSVKTCQNVSKKQSRVKKVPKNGQTSVNNVSKRIKTYQNVSKKYRGAVFRVKTYQKIYFLTLFDTFVDTRFCLLGNSLDSGFLKAALAPDLIMASSFTKIRKVQSPKMGLPITLRPFLKRPNPFSRYLAPLGAKYLEKDRRNRKQLMENCICLLFI